MGLPKNILEAAKAAAAAAVAAEQQLVSPAAQEQHEEGQYDYDQQVSDDDPRAYLIPTYSVSLVPEFRVSI